MNLKTKLGPLTFAVFFILFLLPFFTTGFHYDDWFNSLIPYQLDFEGKSLWSYIRSWIQLWWSRGRFYPLGQILLYPVWNFIGAHALSYRLYQMGLVALNLVLFSKLLIKTGVSRTQRLVACSLVLGLFQMRKYHDPITGYTGLLQLCFLFIVGTVYAYKQFEVSKSTKHFILCLGLFLGGIWTYELCYIALLLVAFLRARTEKNLFRALLLLTASSLLLTLWLRLSHGVGYEGVKTSLSPKIFLTYLWQTTSALPFTYLIFGRSGFFHLFTFFDAPMLSFTTFLAACVFVAYWHIWTDAHAQDLAKNQPLWNIHYSWLTHFGLGLWLLPGLTIAIVEKYQREIARPGHAYLPVYISYFGLAVLLSGPLARWIERGTKERRAATAVILGLLFTLQFGANRVAAQAMNMVWKYPRELIEGANRTGLFANVPEGATILGNQGFDWTEPLFFKMLTGKNFKLSLYKTYFKDHPSLPKDAYFFRYEVKNDSLGMVVFSKIKSLTPDAEFKSARVINDGPVIALLYANDLDLAFRFSGHYAASKPSDKPFSLQFYRADPFKTVDSWRAMQFPAGDYEVSSIDLEINSLEPERDL